MSQSTGCSQPELLERLYQHFAQPSAWDVYPGAPEALRKIRDTGMPCCSLHPLIQTSPSRLRCQSPKGNSAHGVQYRPEDQERWSVC